MNLLSFLTPAALKLAAIAAFLAAVFSGGWWVNGWRWEAKYQKLDAQYQAFSQGVTRLGEQAKTKNALIALDQLKAKEMADEQNRLDHARSATTIAWLRRDADSARGSIVPPAPANTSRPDLLCLDRSEFGRAHGDAVGRLREGARRLADEGTAATVDLDTAKRWASEVHLKLSTTLKGVTP